MSAQRRVMRLAVLPVAALLRDWPPEGRARTVPSAILGLAVFLLVAGCSAAGTGVSASVHGLPTLTVAAGPADHNAQLYNAARYRRFSAPGLQVRIQGF